MKSFIILLSLVSFVTICTISAFSQGDEIPPNPEVIKLVNEGIKYHKNKNFLNAIKSFEDALSIEPNNVLVLENLSIAHNNYGKYLTERTDYEKALKEFRTALYLNPENKIADENLDSLLLQRGVKASEPQTRSQLGDKLRQDANFEGALVEYKKAISLSKNKDPNLLISVGDIYYIIYLREGQRTNHINQALESYRKALETGKTAKAHIKYADALLAMKDITNAIQNYKQAIQLEPDSQEALTANVRGWNEAVRLAPLVPENHIGLASALQLKKDSAGAEEEYNQALKLDPENQLALQGLESLKQDKLNLQSAQHLESALKLQLESKYDEAIQKYIKALEVTPKDPKLHYNIGTAFQAKEDFEHAGKAYKKSLELEPNNAKARIAIESLTNQIQNKKVKELSSRAIELQSSGNYQEAITTYLAAISLTPNDTALYYNLGTAYQANGDLPNAEKQYEKAIELDKNNEVYLNALKSIKTEAANPLIQSAINKQNANDLAGAILDYQKALEAVPENAQVHFNLATAYQANKQIDQAIEEYKKAVQLDSKNQSDACFFLAAVYEEKKDNKSATENYQKYLQLNPTGEYAAQAKERIAYLKTKH